MRIFYKKGFYFEGINTYIPDGAVEITEEQHKKICEDMSKGYILQETEDGYPYTNINLDEETNKKIQEIEDWFQFAITTPVKYTNGLYYEPEYSQQYYTLLQKYLDDDMTLTIWDVSGTIENSKKMTKKELTDLTKFLAEIYEKAYQHKRNELAKL
jgi:hypothetical protein